MSIVFTTHPLHPDAAALLEGVGQVLVGSKLDPATLEEEAHQADVIIVRAPIPERLVLAAPHLKALVRHGAGVDMIPVDVATSLGILVANVPGANARAVAEHALMLALMLLRRFRPVDLEVRGGAWQHGRALAERGRELTDLVVGLVGFGSVGQAAASLFSPLTRRVLAYSPSNRAPAQMRSSLDGVFQESDIVVLCCPLTSETRDLVDAHRLSLMKDGAILVNVARGGVVNDAALLDALQSGRLSGAGLDVFAEQPLPLTHPYFSLPNVIVTPHVASLTADSMRAMGMGAAREAIRVLEGQLPVSLVNPHAMPRYRERFPQAGI